VGNFLQPIRSLHLPLHVGPGGGRRGDRSYRHGYHVLQTLWSLTAGIITDRFGRRRRPLFLIPFRWSIPTLLWAFAQDFRWFLVAGILNAAVRVVHVFLVLSFIEDAPVDLRVRLYTWMSVAGTLSGIFRAPGGLFCGSFWPGARDPGALRIRVFSHDIDDMDSKR